ncbi:hypothetical protein NDU88_011522 [Pleurodeles waltl]|uniref:Uncharacterized protein n=1 Tax=Pleurodeles waltl TaxID=8319 RepID=A0AAV7QXV5_PLEWA|nr:hypothetical protein NDU88_011522 [Pleurodeles waltl]
MPADLDLPSYARAPLSEGALQQHSTTPPVVRSPAAGPRVSQASTSPPNQSHLLSEVVHCQLQLGSSRGRLHHQAAREQASPTAPVPQDLQGHGVHKGRKVHGGRGPIQPLIRPPKPFSLPAQRARRERLTAGSPPSGASARAAASSQAYPREPGPQHRPQSLPPPHPKRRRDSPGVPPKSSPASTACRRNK